jgi:hypothetical protein
VGIKGKVKQIKCKVGNVINGEDIKRNWKSTTRFATHL